MHATGVLLDLYLYHPLGNRYKSYVPGAQNTCTSYI